MLRLSSERQRRQEIDTELLHRIVSGGVKSN
jgi:hypothetical protein